MSAIARQDPGAWLQNPVTGELAQLLEIDDEGTRATLDLWLQPGAAVATAHIHDHFIERFTVLSGEVGFQVAGDERTARGGDATVEVPTGTAHDWWNAGDEVAHVRVEVIGAETADTPALRFIAMIEAVWSLGTLGHVNAKGLPDPLWLAAVMREYRDVIRLARPPALIQTVLSVPLAAIARLLGRDPTAPELHGPAAVCRIDDPGVARQP